MDDLQMIRALLAKPDPCDDVIDRGRHQLQRAAHGVTRGLVHGPARGPVHGPARGPVRVRHRPVRVRHRRTGWLAGGLGLTAAAAAAAVVVASGTTAPTAIRSGHHAVGHSRAAVHLSGGQILLAAAATAATERPGAYWHFKIGQGSGAKSPPGIVTEDTFESWIARDGRYWNAQNSCDGTLSHTVVFEGPGLGGFYLLGGKLTFQRTKELPTDPAALTEWFAERAPTPDIRATPVPSPAGTPPATNTPPATGTSRWRTGTARHSSFVAEALIALQYEVPAPPAVRAAAFRALAAFPDVKNLGAVEGGQGLLISFPREPAGSWIKLVVDPATSLVRSVTTVKGIARVETAEWTNRLPRVVPLGSKYACSGGH